MKVKIPEVGESVFEAVIGTWHKKSGEPVRKGDLLLELETDKVNLEITAEADGLLTTLAEEGATVKIGAVVASIDESATMPPAAETEEVAKAETKEAPPQAAPINPAARKLATEKGVDLDDVNGSGRKGRVTVEDVLAVTPAAPETVPVGAAEGPGDESRITRTPMTPLRKRIAERLLAARQQTAMLTTFNEADLGHVKELRKRYREHFRQKHGVDLGLMSFFVKAVVEALKEFPEVNARIDGDDIVYQHFYDIGIAVGSERGLLVPVLREADRLTFAAIETTLKELSEKVRSRKIELSELEGGTFTISNGGVYGSLQSTPILNPPQSGVLGMHAIKDRPVVQDGEVVIRPMMNLALSYDHRIIDGMQAVSFLKRVVEHIEDPEEMLLEL